MIRKSGVIISFNSFVIKIISCMILSCMILSSAVVLNNNTDNKILESINGAESIFVQFFKVSSMPADLISKIFVQETEQKLAETPTKKSEKQNQAADDSSKYSILSTLLEITDFTNTKNNLSKTSWFMALFDSTLDKQSMYKNFFVDCLCRNVTINLILMTLLLAILLSQINLGEGNIFNINIKKYRAQFA